MNKLEIKTVWPEWEIDELIGEGASGKVYKAKRTDSKDVYSAIKVIEIPQNESEVKEARSEGLDDVSIKQYFKSFVDELISEISLLENLKSAQNIVGIEDYKVIEKEDKIGYVIYIRMELLTGVDNYFSQNALEEKLIVKLGTDLCKALEYCEKLKIIHRDIKPENIFVSKFGEFKLGDFGIARKLENTSSIMSKKGTYIYMAPEVYKGNSYDKTVDIYSLGLVMYRFCNNNRTPFLPEYPQSITFKDKENALYKRMDGEIIPKPTKMSEDLYKIISKMCEYESENRYKNVSDVKRDLEKLLNSGKYEENKESEITHEGTVNIFSEAVKAKKIEQIKKKNQQVNINKIPNASESNKQEEILQKMKKVQTANKNKTVLSNENALNFTDKGNIEVKKETRSSEIKSSTKKIKNKNIKTIIALIIILLLILIFILFKMFAKPKEPKSIEVVNKLILPNVTLMQIEDAKQALSELELDIQIEEIYQEGIENGVVIYQSLEENTPIEKGDKLVLLVNNLEKKQIEKVTIPNVVGKSIDEALTILAELGLMVEKTEEHNNDVEIYMVISQSITENTEVEKGTAVNLTVSLGKEKQEEEPINKSLENKNNANEKSNDSQKSNNQQNNDQKQSSTVQQPSTIQQPSTTQITNNQQTISTWSDWVESLPSGVSSSNYNIETKTQYSYRTVTKEVTYGDWSANKTTTTKPQESDVLKIVDTISGSGKYVYVHYTRYTSTGFAGSCSGSYSTDSHYVRCEKHTITLTEDYGSQVSGYGSSEKEALLKCSQCDFKSWWKESGSSGTTKYVYSERTKSMNNVYGSWSSYSDSVVTANDTTEVRTRSMYRYNAK